MPQGHPLITIMVPTKDRPEFLERTLRYYADTGFLHTIFIADASGPDHHKYNNAIIERFKGKLDIHTYPCPGLTVAKSIQLVNKFVTTPYATFIADDDFLITLSIDRCIDFLEKDPSFGAAHGQALVFTLKSDGAFGEIHGIGEYRMGEIADEKASARLLRLFDNYFVPLFSVCRTAVWKKMWENSDKLNNVAFEGELLPCALCAIEGKIKKLKCLYLIRQDHEKRFHPDPMDWITMGTWQESFKLFRQFVSEAIAQKDKIALPEAQEYFKQAFWRYLGRQMKWQFNERYGWELESTNAFTRKPKRKLNLKKNLKKVYSVFTRTLRGKHPRRDRISKRDPHYLNLRPVLAVIKNNGKHP